MLTEGQIIFPIEENLQNEFMKKSIFKTEMFSKMQKKKDIIFLTESVFVCSGKHFMHS